MQKHYNKAQILVIVMVMIMVIATIVVSTTNTLVKNNNTTARQSKYNMLYSMAEDLSIQFGLEFGNPATSSQVEVFNESTVEAFLATSGFKLASETGSCTDSINKNPQDQCFQCKITKPAGSVTTPPVDIDNKGLNPEANLNGIITVCDTPYIENAEVYKDEILVFDLEGIDDEKTKEGTYTIKIPKDSLSETDDLDLEITIDFTYEKTDGTIATATVKRIEPISGVTLFPALTNANNKYITLTKTANADTYNLKFNMKTQVVKQIEDEADNTPPTPGYIYHLSLSTVTRINQIRLRPYMRSDAENPKIRLGIGTSNTEINITQGRTVEANIYEVIDAVANGSQAIVISTVPAAKYPSFFDYVIKANTIQDDTE